MCLLHLSFTYTARRFRTSPGAPDLLTGLGWLQGSTQNGMYRGCAHSTKGSSQQGLLPEVYRTASTGEVCSPTTECSMSYGTKNPTTKQNPTTQDPGSASSANGSRSHDCSSSAGLLDSYPVLLLYLAGDALHQQPMGSRSHDCSSYVGCGGIPCSTLVSPNASLHRRQQAVAPGWPPYMVPENGFRPAHFPPLLSWSPTIVGGLQIILQFSFWPESQDYHVKYNILFYFESSAIIGSEYIPLYKVLCTFITVT